MLAAREEQGDLPALTCRDNATGEDARPIGIIAFIVDIPPEAQHRHRRVIVVQHVPLRCLTSQLVKDRRDPDRCGRHDLPLHGSWQGNAQTVLHLF